jgi:GT2 family glycosyltransferase
MPQRCILALLEAGERVHHPPLRIVVGIATSGRPLTLARVLERLRSQTRIADAVIVCGAAPADVSGIESGHPGLRCITSDRGLTIQRNAILRAGAAFDVVVFLDDDFVPCPGYLQAVERIFKSRPDVVVGTGHVVADGILGPGLAFEDALETLQQDGRVEPTKEIEDVYNAYGCNMAIRIDVVHARGLEFDETLPLYGWLEDVDFSRSMAAHGRIVKISAARGVHLGVKSGRQSGRRLGYSQVSNPLYLVRKGTCSSGGQRFAGRTDRPGIDARLRAFTVEQVDDLIRDTVADLVRMTFGNRLAGEQIGRAHQIPPFSVWTSAVLRDVS